MHGVVLGSIALNCDRSEERGEAGKYETMKRVFVN
jgi:hypothetical protein